MSTYGIKIGISGKNVQDCTNEELTYSSEFSVWNVFLEGQITLDGSGNGTITHNLGYCPTFDIWLMYAGSTVDSCAYSTSSTLEIRGFTGYGGFTMQYKIYTTKIV